MCRMSSILSGPAGVCNYVLVATILPGNDTCTRVTLGNCQREGYDTPELQLYRERTPLRNDDDYLLLLTPSGAESGVSLLRELIKIRLQGAKPKQTCFLLLFCCRIRTLLRLAGGSLLHASSLFEHVLVREF